LDSEILTQEPEKNESQKANLRNLQKDSLKNIIVGSTIFCFALFQQAGIVASTDYQNAMLWFWAFVTLSLATWGSHKYYKQDKIERATLLLVGGVIVTINVIFTLPDTLQSFYPYTFLLVAVISGFLIKPSAAFSVTAACFGSSFLVVTFVWGFSYDYLRWLIMPAILSLLLAFISWDEAHNLTMAYNWAMASQVRSRKRRDELFESQQQIKKTNNLLATANLRLAENQQELEKAHTELEVLVADLQKLNASKDKFFSIVAHDLKGPFQPLLGLSELIPLIVDTGTPEEVKEMGESINRSAKNVYALLENLLQWSRLEMGRMEYAPTRLNLKEISQGTVTLLTDFATTKGVHLRNTVQSGIFVYADENMLYTILRNLTSNAIKFTPSHGVVTISTRRKGDLSDGKNFLEVSVSDTGVGITQQNMNKLFKIDEHVTTLGTAKEQGTGLGLIMCKEMVEKNGGRIWIESEVGQGTTMWFTIPLNDPLPEEPPILDSPEEVEPNKAVESANVSEATAELMVVPSLDKMAVLMDLAMLGDMQAIEAWSLKIEQESKDYIPFITKLRALAKGFEDESILALVESLK